MNRMKRVFFLGAGFSKAIVPSYPLLGKLLEEIEPKIADNNENLKAFYNNIPTMIKSNIENLMTYLIYNTPHRAEGVKAISSALYEDILHQLSLYFSNIANDNFWDKCDATIRDNLLKLIVKKQSSLEFITLNYDIVLERIFWMAYSKIKPEPTLDEFYKYRMIGVREVLGNYRFRSNHNYPSIIKLHGSANWLWTGTSSYEPIYHRDFHNEESISSNVFAGLKPFMVPPILDKGSFYNHNILKFLWGKASEVLKEAEEIYIVGFSFPQTDLPIKYLFQDTLHNSNANIYIINNDNEENLRKNYNEVFGTDNANVNYKFTGKENSFKEFLDYILKQD